MLSDDAFAACQAADVRAGAVLRLTQYTAATVDGKRHASRRFCVAAITARFGLRSPFRAAACSFAPARWSPHPPPSLPRPPPRRRAWMTPPQFRPQGACTLFHVYGVPRLRAPRTHSPQQNQQGSRAASAAHRGAEPVSERLDHPRACRRQGRAAHRQNGARRSERLFRGADGRAGETARSLLSRASLRARFAKGTTIQATAWREAADALFPVFEDGKVRCSGGAHLFRV